MRTTCISTIKDFQCNFPLASVFYFADQKMKAKSVPAKFNFIVRTVKLDNESSQEFRLILKRRGKAISSKIYRRLSQITPINENLQFPTTLEQNDKGGYELKKVTLELQVKDTSEVDMQSMSADIELTFFLESKQFNILLCNDKLNADVRLEGSAETEGFNPARCSSVLQSAEWFKSSQTVTDKENIPSQSLRKRDSSKSPFGLAKKTKTWLKKDNDDAKSVELRQINTTHNMKAKSEYAIEQPPAESEARKKWQKCSIDTDKQLKPKKRVLFHEQNNVAHQIQNDDEEDDRKSPSINDCRSTKSIDANIMENEVSELRRSNKIIKKEMDDLKSRLSECEIKENAKSTLEQSVIARLKQEVAFKNKTITALEQKVEGLRKDNRELVDEVSVLKRQVAELKTSKDLLGKEKLPTPINQRDSLGNKDQIDKMKKIHEEQVIELKKKLSEVKKQLLFKDIQHASVPADHLNTQVCLSKQCDSQRKQLKNTIKSLKKSLEEIQAKLKTKEKLLETYNNLQADRERQNPKSKQQQKWKAQKILLQQQIADLKQRQQQTNNLQSQGNKLQRELYVRRSEKQSLQKELQKFKKVYYQSGQQREQQCKQLKQQVLSSKQQIMHLLNAVQEYGGRLLFDKISAVIN